MEDDAFLRTSLCEALTARGHDVAEAANGSDGMRALKTQAPDLVITDIVMADGEGIGAIVEMHAAMPSLPVIAISGNPMYLDHGLKLGARHALLKPFEMAALIACIEDCLQSAPDSDT